MKEKLDSVLSIRPEVVHSIGFCQTAKECIWEWERDNDPSSPYLPKLEAWAFGTYRPDYLYRDDLPIMWGSGWAVDVPYYLNFLVEDGYTKEQIYEIVGRLHTCQRHEEEDEWPLAFRVSEWVRKGADHETVRQLLAKYRESIEKMRQQHAES